MIKGNAAPNIDDEPIFAAELTPYRSLGYRGFKILLMIAGIMSLMHIVVFLVIGAWPIVFFFGLDLILLFGAFWLNYHAARAARRSAFRAPTFRSGSSRRRGG